MALVTLKKRAEFLRIRGGARFAGSTFVLEAKPRTPAGPAADPGPRFGFTITKALGGAVVRNRIRRRLRAALLEVAPVAAQDGMDYVVIARQPAATRPFEDLKKDLEHALQRVHHPQRQQRRPKRGEPEKRS